VMAYLYLIAFIAGLLLAVRLMFFGAERRRQRPGVIPLRRSEPAAVGFLVMFGVAGYLLSRHGTLSPLWSAGAAIVLGAAWAVLVARLAILMARVTPAHDPDDPRYRLQGHVCLVSAAIPADGAGAITFDDGGGIRSVAARSIDGQPIDAGLEVCIERIDEDVAFVELWSLVEARL
jgi:membrane protein implicated in regulation of membrane protease activity